MADKARKTFLEKVTGGVEFREAPVRTDRENLKLALKKLHEAFGEVLQYI